MLYNIQKLLYLTIVFSHCQSQITIIGVSINDPNGLKTHFPMVNCNREMISKHQVFGLCPSEGMLISTANLAAVSGEDRFFNSSIPSMEFEFLRWETTMGKSRSLEQGQCTQRNGGRSKQLLFHLEGQIFKISYENIF